ncbi:MAG: zinc ABC transporter substrate-binding protein [Clostridiales bacterium]|nr:zinc ABC transporter substrate-binding protein [Clostridiales bacterium]
MMRNKILLPIMTAVLMLFSGCAPKTAPDNGKIKVYTSFYAMYDLTRAVAGDRAEVINLLPAGAEPHDYEPTAKDAAQVYQADVLIRCKSGIDDYINDIADEAQKSGACVADTAHGIEIKNGDPHVWLSPDNAMSQLKTIADTLCAADPDNNDYYTQNYNNAADKMRALTEKYEELKGKINTRHLVVSHGAFGYLCDYLGIEQTAVEGMGGESDPSAAAMAQTADFIRSEGIKYIFAESGESNKVMDSLARETGAQLLTLSTFEYDTQDRDYFTVMEENLTQLETALE